MKTYPHILWKPVVHYHAHNKATMIRMKQCHILIPVSSKPLFNVTLSPTLTPERSLPFSFPDRVGFLASNILTLKIHRSCNFESFLLHKTCIYVKRGGEDYLKETCHLLSRWYLFDHEDRRKIFLRNIGWLSTGYTALYHRRQCSS
jgi:hypothetical protein